MNIKNIWRYLPILSIFGHINKNNREYKRIKDELKDVVPGSKDLEDVLANVRKRGVMNSLQGIGHILYGMTPIIYLTFALAYNTFNPLEIKRIYDQSVRDNKKIEQLVSQVHQIADTDGDGTTSLDELAAAYQRAKVNPQVHIDAYGNFSFRVDLKDLEKVTASYESERESKK